MGNNPQDKEMPKQTKADETTVKDLIKRIETEHKDELKLIRHSTSPDLDTLITAFKTEYDFSKLIHKHYFDGELHKYPARYFTIRDGKTSFEGYYETAEKVFVKDKSFTEMLRRLNSNDADSFFSYIDRAYKLVTKINFSKKAEKAYTPLVDSIFEIRKALSTHDGSGITNTKLRKILYEIMLDDGTYSKFDLDGNTIGFIDGIYSFKHKKLLSLNDRYDKLNEKAWNRVNNDPYTYQLSQVSWNAINPISKMIPFKYKDLCFYHTNHYCQDELEYYNAYMVDGDYIIEDNGNEIEIHIDDCECDDCLNGTTVPSVEAYLKGKYFKMKTEYEEFISKIIPNKELKEYLLTSYGRSLNPENTDTFVRFLTNAGGSNGKSVMTNLVHLAVGDDYSVIANPNLFEGSKNSSASASPDIHALKGKRIGIVEEPDKGAKLNASKIKRLCGGDKKKITSRALYKNEMESFILEAQWFINANLMPDLDSGDGDGGTQRRIKKVPFESKFVDDECDVNHSENKYLKKSLTKEQERLFPKFLIWDLLMRVDKPLVEPECVSVETKELHEEQNTVQQFIESDIEVTNKKEDFINKNTMYHMYKHYVQNNINDKFDITQKTAITNFKANDMLSKYYKDKVDGNRSKGGWFGLKLKDCDMFD